MKEESRIPKTTLVSAWTRRGLFKKAGLMGLAVMGLGSGVAGMIGRANADGPQRFSHPNKRAGSQVPMRTPPPKRKTITELLTILQSHTDGPQAIEAARNGGARLTPPASNHPSLPLANAGPSFSVVLVPGHLQVGQSWVRLREVDVLQDSTFQLQNDSQAKSRAILKIAFPKKGWYLLNIEGALPPNSDVSAKIRQLGPTIPGLPFQAWSYPKNVSNQPAGRSFPAVFEYKGSKYPLEFYIENGGACSLRK